MITADPLYIPSQLTSEIAVNVYVVVAVGLTKKVYGVVGMEFTVTGVVPLVYVTLQGAVPVS